MNQNWWVELMIRRASRGDLEAVKALSESWVGEAITYGQVSEPIEWFEARVDAYFFVAEVDGGVVGYGQGDVRVSDERVAAVLSPGTRYVEITNLYVHPDYRSRGVGSGLLEHLLEAAGADGVDRSLLFTGTKDVLRVLRFYMRHGYEGWGVQMVR